MASTINTLHRLIPRHPSFRNPTDTRMIESRLFGLYASQAAQLFISLLLPFGNEHRIRVFVLYEPIVELFGDGWGGVEFPDIARALVVNLEDRPEHLFPPFSFVRCVFSILHLILKLKQCVFEILETIRWRFSLVFRCTDWWHCFVWVYRLLVT